MVGRPGPLELVRCGRQPDIGAEVAIPIEFADLEEPWTAHTSAGPLQKLLDVAGPAAVGEVIDAVLKADRKPDGALRQDNVMRYVRADKP